MSTLKKIGAGAVIGGLVVASYGGNIEQMETANNFGSGIEVGITSTASGVSAISLDDGNLWQPRDELGRHFRTFPGYVVGGSRLSSLTD